MELTKDITYYIQKSVLCWLATVSKDHVPNVSPKEIFTSYKKEYILVANIASPQTVKNIISNENVCISFIDILVQKGFQLKGKAKIIKENDVDFLELKNILSKLTQGQFPFATITKIKIESAKPIIAPRYLLYPETTESEQIKSAKSTYGF